MYCDFQNGILLGRQTLSSHTHTGQTSDAAFLYVRLGLLARIASVPISLPPRRVSHRILFSASYTRKSGLPALWVAALGHTPPPLLHLLVLLEQDSFRTFSSDLQANLLRREAS